MDIVTLALARKKAKQYTDTVISNLPKGVVYKGSVNYYTDLPNNADLGDCYTILYTGTSGTTAFNAEYVWGVNTATSVTEWIKIGEDIDLSGYEVLSNKVTSISNSSTDIQYPSALAVYNYVDSTIGDINDILDDINGEVI